MWRWRWRLSCGLIMYLILFSKDAAQPRLRAVARLSAGGGGVSGTRFDLFAAGALAHLAAHGFFAAGRLAKCAAHPADQIRRGGCAGDDVLGRLQRHLPPVPPQPRAHQNQHALYDLLGRSTPRTTSSIVCWAATFPYEALRPFDSLRVDVRPAPAGARLAAKDAAAPADEGPL